MTALSRLHIKPWREIAIAMTILMEVSWITPWFRSLTPETYAINPLRALAFFVVVIMFSHILIRSMDYLKLRKQVRQILMIILLIFGCLLAIKAMVNDYESASFSELISRPIRSFADLKYLVPVEFIIIITVVLASWRGITLAQEHIGPSIVMSHFWMGIVFFIVFIFFNTLITGEKAGEFFFLFVFSSLLGVSAARMTVIGLIRGGAEAKFERSWFVGILLTVIIVSGLAILLGNLVGRQLTDFGTIFIGLLGSILILLWLIINPVLSFIANIISRLFKDAHILEDMGNTLQNLNEMMAELRQILMDKFDDTGIGSFLSGLAPMIKTIILTGIIILIVVFVIWWMAMKLWKDREGRLAYNEEKSSLLSGNLVGSLLNILLRGWGRTRDSLGQLFDLKNRQRMKAAARIRQIYSEILELCAMLDQPRPEAITPLEFEPKIDRIFPDYQQEIKTITQAYLRVRYGLMPETQGEVSAVEAAWKKISNAGHEILQKQKHSKL